MISSFFLLSASYWVDIHTQRALVCDINQLSFCLQQLPESSLTHLPQDAKQLREVMGHRHAMVLPITQPENISGLILLNKEVEPKSVITFIGRQTLQLNLFRQQELSLWHEQGHLANKQLQATILPQQLSRYEHEWLADVYVLWRSVKETGTLELAWQQYHRRNLAAIDDPINLSHWSSPYLLRLMSELSVTQIQQFSQYSDFVKASYLKLNSINPRRQKELNNLVKFIFNNNKSSELPNYLYWRRAELNALLKPTFIHLLGESKTEALLNSLMLITTVDGKLNPS
ncbi:hypothetical protein D5R81_06660 [Parashewanella spongiae]|uniref:Uncharacterized protein n=1 Tax=Parashewanella spongiae TaxID=342950 RepID=A0A3A6TYE6_9GAMM|nr:hypothetical protein [Parashewanella spongiae]MCL1077655.1 hypothetical protein [Parashewanella spongiae]RJY18118.1 hypothetical protein D5R81_06660 [Parashewanella spongiae]